MPMEVGELRNCCSYAFAAAMSALPALSLLAVALLLLLLLLVLLLVLPLLLHAAIASAEVTAMTAAEIFLIRAFILAAPGAPSGGLSTLSQVSVLLLSWFST